MIKRRVGDPLVGAAIGVGMTAEAAERGGADFLLALNAGRYRVMGTASAAAMMPIADANAFTDAFARREILDRVSIPVFFGACAFDPRLDLERFVAELAEAGYDGVANFPTCIHYDGRLRRALEDAGLGFAREARLIGAARRAGLQTFGYAKARREIDLLLEAGADIVCLNFGWNAGGVRGVLQDISLTEAADRARRVFSEVRAAAPEVLCVVEGGPIVRPEDMYEVCREARADGYVGGSTLDRVPLEHSVMQVTSAFKAVSVLREASLVQDRQVAQAARLAGIVGHSPATRALLERAVRLSASGLPILVTGEPGTGKLALARATHALARRPGPILHLNLEQAGDPEVFLFGTAARHRTSARGALETAGASVVLERAHRLTDPLASRLIDWLDAGERARPSRPAPPARLVLVTREGEAEGAAGRGLHELFLRCRPGHLALTPLRERLEDIPSLVRAIGETALAGARGGRVEVTADGLRALFAHDWPGNLRELRAVLEQAALDAGSGAVDAALLRRLLARSSSPNGTPVPPEGERAWILDALRRNRFRRGETAEFLGLSRKTLYNRMKRLGLLD